LTTTGYKIDRRLTAELLGFDDILTNSIDAVGSRDFILEAMATYALIAADLSRLCEEVILFSSDGYKMVELADEYSSTSSIMPQKKNPDSAEIARAKCARIIGLLTAAFTLCKGLPFSYNRDLQELNALLWESCKLTLSTLRMVERMVATLKVDRGRMRMLVEQSYATATELADTLVRECDIPFRTAHIIVGMVVKEAVENGVEPSKISLEMINRCSKEVLGRTLTLSEEAVRKALNPTTFIARREVEGGPAPQTLAKALVEKEGWLNGMRSSIREKRLRLQMAQERLTSLVSEYTKLH
jgi:argininosuccinate lyase